MALFRRDDEPVSPYFPVRTPSRRALIEQRQRENDSRRAAERLWAAILVSLQPYAERLRR